MDAARPPAAGPPPASSVDAAEADLARVKASLGGPGDLKADWDLEREIRQAEKQAAAAGAEVKQYGVELEAAKRTGQIPGLKHGPTNPQELDAERREANAERTAVLEAAFMPGGGVSPEPDP